MFTEHQLRGELVIENISGSALQIVDYSYELAAGESLDLLDPDTPHSIRAGNHQTAKNMVGRAGVGIAPRHTDYELAQRIAVNELRVTVDTEPVFWSDVEVPL